MKDVGWLFKLSNLGDCPSQSQGAWYAGFLKRFQVPIPFIGEPMAERKVVFNGVEFIGCKPPPDQSEIDAMVQTYGLTLPDDYLRFLLRVNGGRTRANSFQFPRWTSVTEWPEPQPVETEWMIPKPTGEQLKLLKALAEIKAYTKHPPKVKAFSYIGRGDHSLKTLLAGRLLSRKPDPSSLFPIAFNDGNSPIGMSLSEQYFGNLFQFSEEMDESQSDLDLKTLDKFLDLKIADSFSEFVRGLFKGKTVLKPGFTPNKYHLDVLKMR